MAIRPAGPTDSANTPGQRPTPYGSEASAAAFGCGLVVDLETLDLVVPLGPLLLRDTIGSTVGPVRRVILEPRLDPRTFERYSEFR